MMAENPILFFLRKPLKTIKKDALKKRSSLLGYNRPVPKRSLPCIALLLFCGNAAMAQDGPALPVDLRDRDCEHYLGSADLVITELGPDLDRLREVSALHRLHGTASYYSTFFNDRKTANGERFHNSRISAAHRTLPMGTWVEVRSLATGRKIRLRVNDRGPFKGGFIIDLSQAAARRIGVDRAADRRVEVTLLALPGEDPPREDESDGNDEAERAALVEN